MPKFRFQRGGLDESMRTVRDVCCLQELNSVLFNSGLLYPEERCTVKKYGDGIDERNGWDTHIVTVPRFGAVGFTDGAVEYSFDIECLKF